MKVKIFYLYPYEVENDLEEFINKEVKEVVAFEKIIDRGQMGPPLIVTLIYKPK